MTTKATTYNQNHHQQYHPVLNCIITGMMNRLGRTRNQNDRQPSLESISQQEATQMRMNTATKETRDSIPITTAATRTATIAAGTITSDTTTTVSTVKDNNRYIFRKCCNSNKQPPANQENGTNQTNYNIIKIMHPALATLQ
jgi:hypothetical protein